MFELTWSLVINSYPLKHNVSFEVPLMYLRILLTMLQCSFPGFSKNQLTFPTTCAMSDLVQIIANIKFSTTDA